MFYFSNAQYVGLTKGLTPTPSGCSHTGVLEELTTEIPRLEKRQEAARAEVERAAEMLEELNTRRFTLAPGPLFIR